MFDVEEVAEAVLDIVEKPIAEMARRIDAAEKREPVHGKDGAQGRDGKDADPVTREQIIEAILAMPDVLDAAVQRYLEAKPPQPGKDGAPGRDGKDGAPGQNGVDGKDGLSLAGAVIDRSGGLVVTLSNGETKELGPVVGRDGRDGVDGKNGEPGENGKDGFSLKAFEAELMPDGRTVLLKFDDGGDISFSVELGFPVMIYRGVFSEGKAYEKGDTVTWGGHLWHCNEKTTEKPMDGQGVWTLAAKRGRDGKEVVTIKPRKDEPVKV